MEIDLEEEKDDETELDPIRIQLAYLAFTCGNKQEAEKILTLVLSHPTTSKVITAIASCNLIAARGCVDITEGYKRMKSISVDTFNTSPYSEEELIDIINQVFDLRPSAIIETLDLRRPIYRQVAAYGHFGRDDIDVPWEKLNKVDEILKVLKKD